MEWQEEQAHTTGSGAGTNPQQGTQARLEVTGLVADDEAAFDIHAPVFH